MSTYTKDENGFVRITSNDGRRSELYDRPSNAAEAIIRGHGDLIEVAEHHEDGTTDAWEWKNGSRGEHK